jgi:hypothetical protein
MDLWERLWRRAIKDVLLTGLGMYAIWRGIGPPVSLGVIGGGLVLTVPASADHLKALLPSSGDSRTSASSHSRGERDSPPSSGGRSGD